jgi:hypothetical protein
MVVLAQHGFAQACVVGHVAARQADAPMLRVV